MLKHFLRHLAIAHMTIRQARELRLVVLLPENCLKTLPVVIVCLLPYSMIVFAIPMYRQLIAFMLQIRCFIRVLLDTSSNINLISESYCKKFRLVNQVNQVINFQSFMA